MRSELVGHRARCRAGAAGNARSAAAAQPATPTTNAMNCWWATDKSAVHVGEPFGLTLTCRVMETARASVVPNVTEIEPTSIQLTPFDVLGGTRHEDIVTPPWRYLQFVYTVRLLGEEFFGRDLAIPPTNVTFRIRTGGAEAAEGAEHTYVLPSIPIRILSLLPAQAADIRDPSPETFGDIEARRFRSTVELVAGAILLGFAAVLLAFAAVRAMRAIPETGRARRTHGAGPLSCSTAVCAKSTACAPKRCATGGRRDWPRGRLHHSASARRLRCRSRWPRRSAAGDAPARDGQLAVRIRDAAAAARPHVRADDGGCRRSSARTPGNGQRPPEVNPERPRPDSRGARRPERRALRPQRQRRRAGARPDTRPRRERAAPVARHAALAGTCRQRTGKVGRRRRDRMARLTDLLIVVRRTLDEWVRIRWSDLHFTAADTALLVLIVLLATAVLMAIARSIRSPRARRAAVGVPALLPVMRRSTLSGLRHTPFLLFLAGLPFFAVALANPVTAVHPGAADLPGPPDRAGRGRVDQHDHAVRDVAAEADVEPRVLYLGRVRRALHEAAHARALPRSHRTHPVWQQRLRRHAVYDRLRERPAQHPADQRPGQLGAVWRWRHHHPRRRRAGDQALRGVRLRQRVGQPDGDLQRRHRRQARSQGAVDRGAGGDGAPVVDSGLHDQNGLQQEIWRRAGRQTLAAGHRAYGRALLSAPRTKPRSCARSRTSTVCRQAGSTSANTPPTSRGSRGTR